MVSCPLDIPCVYHATRIAPSYTHKGFFLIRSFWLKSQLSTCQNETEWVKLLFSEEQGQGLSGSMLERETTEFGAKLGYVEHISASLIHWTICSTIPRAWYATARQQSCKQPGKRGLKMAFPKVNCVPAQLRYGFVSPLCYQSVHSVLMMVPVFVTSSASLRMKLWLALVGLLVRIFLGTDIREWSENECV